MAGPLQHPALAGPQGKDVARPAQVIGPGGGVDGYLDRAGPVLGGNAGADAVFRAGINADREGCLIFIGVAMHHQGQLEGIEAFPLHGEANQAPGLGGHEIDLLRGGELGRTDQIPFVFSVFVIHHHHHLAIADRG